MINANVPTLPGSIELQEVIHSNELGSTDITLMVQNIEINTAISQTSSFAEVFISDFNNLFERAFINSGDIIKIKFKSKDRQQERTYKIQNVKNILNMKTGRGYTLTLVTHLEYISFYSKLSRSFVGSTSEIATQIYEEFAKEKVGIWEQSVGVQTVCIPTWSPLKTINWLARRSRSAENSSRFLFFQDSTQAFHFTSMPKLKDYYGNNIITYRYMSNVFGKESAAGLNPNTDAQIREILDLDFLNSFDIRKAINFGSLHNTKFITDITNKKFNIQTNTYWDTYSLHGLNPRELWRKEDYTPGNIDRQNVTFNSSVQPGYNERLDETSKNYVFDASQQIEIVVHGNVAVDIGQILNIEIPPAEQEQLKENQIDMRWSGKYYVVGKKDQITTEGHRMALRLAKDTNL